MSAARVTCMTLEGSGQIPVTMADTAPPNLPPSLIAEFAERAYGLKGALSFLPSERDQIAVFSVDGHQRFTLRISGIAEPLELIELQNRALAKIAADDADLPVPRLQRSRRQSLIEIVRVAGQAHHARLLTFLPGTPLVTQRRHNSVFGDIGRSLARLDAALSGLAFPTMARTLLWDVQQALTLVPLLEHLHDAEQRRLVGTVFDALAGGVLARLKSMRPQVIHNDFNPKNILIDPAAPERVSGIIDFGDLTDAPRIVDLGVAVARNVDLPNPLVAGCEIVAGYNAVLPLTDEEIELLHFVVCARLAMRTVIWSWRRDANDARCDPAQISHAIGLLHNLLATGASEVTAMFRRACNKG